MNALFLKKQNKTKNYNCMTEINSLGPFQFAVFFPASFCLPPWPEATAWVKATQSSH